MSLFACFKVGSAQSLKSSCLLIFFILDRYIYLIFIYLFIYLFIELFIYIIYL